MAWFVHTLVGLVYLRLQDADTRFAGRGGVAPAAADTETAGAKARDA